MLTKNLLLSVGLAALAVAEPIPQAAPTSSYNAAALSSEYASLSALEAITSIFSDLPTLPASVESVLATAFPSSLATETDIACQLETAVPAWYNSIPADVKSALTSYESALVSWSKEHSAALASLTSGYSAPTGAVSGISIGVCSNTGAAVVATTGTGTGTTAKNTGTAAGATGTGQSAGTATSSGSAAGASSSKAAAPRATGAVAVSFVGFFGMLGLMAAL